MDDIVSRPYMIDDFAACLAIFDSNVPTFLAPEERAEFRQFLESIDPVDGTYLVVAQRGSVIACGGLATEAENRQARLAWGMVTRACHGQGVGNILMQARLKLARDQQIAEVAMATSQHTRGFYEKFGFTVSNVTPDGFGLGLDRCDMTLRFPKA